MCWVRILNVFLWGIYLARVDLIMENSERKTGSIYSLLSGKLGRHKAINYGFDIKDNALGMCTCLNSFEWTGVETEWG